MVSDDARAAALLEFTRLPSPTLDVPELTERDKVALCIHAGCDYRMEMEQKGLGFYVKVTTANLVGIVKIDGQFKGCERKPIIGETITIPLEKLYG